MYTPASSCLKWLRTEWCPRNKPKKKKKRISVWAATSFPWPAARRVARRLSASAPAGRQQQLIEPEHFWWNRLSIHPPLTCDPARTPPPPLSCILGESNWASEKLSASRQEHGRTLRHCEKTHRSANASDGFWAPLAIPFFLSLFLIWRGGWGRALPFDCLLPVKRRKKNSHSILQKGSGWEI